MRSTGAFLQAWVDTVQDHAIFLLDPAGDVASWNAGAAGILGYTGEEALGEPFSAFFSPEDREAGEPGREIREALAGGRCFEERWYVRKDGTPFWASGTLTALRDEGGGVRFFVAALRDLTHRKRLEEEVRRHAEALAEADRRKDEFLAVLAHELRNPMAAILHAAAVLRPGGSLDAEGAAHAGATIEHQVGNMRRLVDDLLDASRLANRKVSLHPHRVDLGELIGRVAEVFRPRLGERAGDLAVLLPGAPVRVMADPVRLEQVVLNLLDNAAKYSGPGDAIVISAGLEGGEAVVRVRDEGIGIAPEALGTIFDLYSQADRSIGRSAGGLGIGLGLARQLVELHGGAIEARSPGHGRGSEFIVRLPPLGEVTGESIPPTGAPRTGARRSVLAVDDDAAAAAALKHLLGKAGHDVRVAHDGPTALAELEAWTPDVALLDVELPGMGGRELARAIRSRMPGVRLVALTGWSHDLGGDFDAHLVKPVDPDELLRSIAEAGRRV